MKYSGILGIAIVVSTIVTLVYGQVHTKRVTAKCIETEFAKRNLPLTEIEFVSTQKDINSDFEKFIKEANKKINSNDNIISELAFNSTAIMEESIDDLSIKIKAVSKRNYDLKIKLDYYVEAGTGNWQTFKSDLYAELADLNLAIKNI